MKKLKYVTFTGADESVDPSELIKISFDCPSVEWGILFSGSKCGVPRYPAYEWVDTLARGAKAYPERINLSAHLCGQYQRDIAFAGDTYSLRFTGMTEFRRVQINAAGQWHKATRGLLRALAMEPYEFIFQVDSEKDKLYVWSLSRISGSSVLFDTSGGSGPVPRSWPWGWGGASGYAGGLCPDNIARLMPIIREAAKVDGILGWVDMESGVRSGDGRRFDLDKVKSVIETLRSGGWL